MLLMKMLLVEVGTPYEMPRNYSGLRFDDGPNSGTGFLLKSYLADKIKQNSHIVIPVVIFVVLGCVVYHAIQVVCVFMYKKFYNNKQNQKPGNKPNNYSRYK